jgi:NAD(P)-dependent dehydrogenase (short-subunit alcohol dehydrogenase family)
MGTTMTTFNDTTVAITGAASGIGRALATASADRGAQLAICDVDEEGLAETRQKVQSRGARCITERVDVSERDAVQDWADSVQQEFGSVGVIINNAGVSVSGSVEGVSIEDFEWLMSINFWGVVYGTRAFLPLIRKAGQGRVVNVSSIFGIVASPTQSAYNAAKFAVRGFTESLRTELEFDDAEIGASCVHPGGIDTEIVRNARYADTGAMDRDREEIIEEFEKMIARTSPEDAAETILDGVEADKGRILVGADAMVLDLFQRLVPGSYPGWLAKWISRTWE